MKAIFKDPRTYLIVICALMVVSCSKNKGEAPASHYDGYHFDGNFSIVDGKYQMECTPLIPVIGGIQAKMKLFRHNGQVYSNLVDLRISSHIDLTNKHLAFFRWAQNSNGQFSGDQNPLRFDVQIGNQIYDGLYHLTNSGPTQGMNVNQMLFTIHGTDIGYHALQIALYNQSGEIEAYSDGLIPMVMAHPNDYKQHKPNENLLRALHPYRNELNSNASSKDFATRSYNDFCFN